MNSWSAWVSPDTRISQESCFFPLPWVVGDQQTCKGHTSTPGLPPTHGTMPPEHPSPAQMGLTSTHCSFPSPQVLQQNTVQARFYLLMATIPHGSSKAHVPKVHGDSKCPFLLLSPKPLLQEGLDSFTTAGPSCREVMAELCPALCRAALPVPPTPGSDLLSQGVILVVSMEVAQHLSSKNQTNSIEELCAERSWERHLLASSQSGHAADGETARIRADPALHKVNGGGLGPVRHRSSGSPPCSAPGACRSGAVPRDPVHSHRSANTRPKPGSRWVGRFASRLRSHRRAATSP